MSEQFTIPIAGSINNRIKTPAVLTIGTGIVGVGIVGLMIVGSTGSTSTTDQRFVNCFAHGVTNPYSGKKTYYLLKRPGLAPSPLTPQAGSIGNAILIWTGATNKIISAFGETNSSIYDSATQLVTNAVDTSKITGKARSITETRVGSDTATVTIASEDSTGWFYQPSGTVTKIADADFPGNAGFTTVGGFAHMDGFAFIATSDGKLWNSDVNSITAWTATSFVSANSYPDAGVGVVRKGDKLMYFGTESVQFFHNAGNESGSPLSRVEPMTLRIGCVSGVAITEVSGTIFWAGSSPQGGMSIYSYGNQAQRISTPEVDSALLLAGTANISLSAVKFFGLSFVIVQASSITFVYCIEDPGWHEWSSSVPLWHRTAGVSAGTAQVTYAISKVSLSGKIYIIDPAAFTFRDDGTVYTALTQLTPLGEPNRKTYWEELEVNGDRETSTSRVSISTSDDDYGSTLVRGIVDLSAPRARITRLGAAYLRSWILSHSDNTPFRIENLKGRKSTGTA